MEKEIRIRFNTNCNDGLHYWRVIYDNVEHLATELKIEVPTYSTKDFIDETTGYKWHIGCKVSEIIWNEDNSVILK